MGGLHRGACYCCPSAGSYSPSSHLSCWVGTSPSCHGLCTLCLFDGATAHRTALCRSLLDIRSTQMTRAPATHLAALSGQANESLMERGGHRVASHLRESEGSIDLRLGDWVLEEQGERRDYPKYPKGCACPLCVALPISASLLPHSRVGSLRTMAGVTPILVSMGASCHAHF